MAFPVYYKGQILFRDGRPAMSLNCCCNDRTPRLCCCNESFPPLGAQAAFGFNSIGMYVSGSATPVRTNTNGCTVWNAFDSGVANDMFGNPHTWELTWTQTCELVRGRFGALFSLPRLAINLKIDGGALADITGYSDDNRNDSCAKMSIISVTGDLNLSGGYD